jgi:hypothetical protein|tara:strand:+ start:2039 stop:2188 length:150 start_codon:yes stop_codon:yes gene_type:complete
MIGDIISALKFDFKSDSEYVAIARGKYKLPTTIKEGYKELKELWQLKKQ